MKHKTFRVIARSTCQELAGDEVLLETNDEREALDCATKNKPAYYRVDIVRVCHFCGQELSECCCEAYAAAN